MRAILFDIDGTLIRTGGAGVKAFARVSAEVFGLPEGTAHIDFHGRTDTALIRGFLRHHRIGDTPENMDRFLTAYLERLAVALDLHSGEQCPGVGSFIRACRELSPAPLIGLLTGNVRRGAELKLRAHGLWGEFAMGGYGDDHEERGEIARVALSRAGQHLGEILEGPEVVVVGDTLLDVACARVIGARCLAVSTGGVTRQELAASNPDWLVDSLESIHPRELRSGDSGSQQKLSKSVREGFLV